MDLDIGLSLGQAVQGLVRRFEILNELVVAVQRDGLVGDRRPIARLQVHDAQAFGCGREPRDRRRRYFAFERLLRRLARGFLGSFHQVFRCSVLVAGLRSARHNIGPLHAGVGVADQALEVLFGAQSTLTEPHLLNLLRPNA